ncbi:hypothetical protein O6H91_23G015600 [Diphasiastrum complanatum]|uniref:Uncharacterized protein n=1 Tax=Diphasiastrum complanatum TaxID=34168 RepID=A0ACC2A8D1_DIPCM|nr:hypothetical protein O6H91_23G015600 [Diphasiastrum complanatum]
MQNELQTAHDAPAANKPTKNEFARSSHTIPDAASKQKEPVFTETASCLSAQASSAVRNVRQPQEALEGRIATIVYNLHNQLMQIINANQSLRVKLQAAISCQATFGNFSKVSEKLFK